MIKDILCTNNFTINTYTETEYTFFVRTKLFTLKECNCCIEVLLQKNRLMTIIFFSFLNRFFTGIHSLAYINIKNSLKRFQIICFCSLYNYNATKTNPHCGIDLM